MTAEQIIKRFKMQPLRQEGGYYIETYRAAEQLKKEILPFGVSGDRNISSVILYLLTAKTVSLMHRLKCDEMFHFYLGNPVTMLQLHPDGSSEIVTLGHDILNEQKVQVLVPKGTWQGAFIQPGGKFSLMGCSVAPAFDEADFEIGDRETLLVKYPDMRELILHLTHAH
ncbi:MAG: cupin domain-containing protein [Sedimentisphaerales bacterium]|jgi:predicted cupin superfamily sugar epimerase